jgi:uncharacterized lipoprotein YmbA
LKKGAAAKRRWDLFFAAALLLTTACSTPPPLPNDHYYRLPAVAPAQRFDAPRIDGLVVVERPRATAVHATRALAYTEDAGHLTLAHYHYHYWADPPAQLLQQGLIDYLRAANLAPAVAAEAGRLATECRISGVLRRFERQRSGDGWQVAVALELRADAGGSDRPVLLRQYEFVAPAQDDSIEATVRAFAAATGDVFSHFLADLGQALPVTATARP